VGRFAVQLAAHAGAAVIAVAGSAERGQGLRDLGAHEVVTDLADVSGPLDLVLESVGGSSLAQAFGLIAPGGTIVTFGNSSREPTTFNVGTFYMRDGARLVGFSLLAPTQQSGLSADLGYLASLMASEELSPQIGFETSWRQAPEALARLRDRQVQGKAVLQVD
jgi:NADPH:quinone reductase-like Zn-dependent oxidoreductase